jgi:hypothetical protein
VLPEEFFPVAPDAPPAAEAPAVPVVPAEVPIEDRAPSVT